MPPIVYIAGFIILLILVHGFDKSLKQRDKTNRKLDEISRKLDEGRDK